METLYNFILPPPKYLLRSTQRVDCKSLAGITLIELTKEAESAMWKIKAVYNLIGFSENMTSVKSLPEIHSLNITRRKHQTNQN